MVMISLQLAADLQEILNSAEIPSVVTGVWALIYYGVDIVLHDVEICVPLEDIDRATEALEAHSDMYRRLPDCKDPDLYHCYRQGTKEFETLSVQPPLLLVLISDTKLRMEISATTMTRGLIAEAAHEELRKYCGDVPPGALSRLSWPTLVSFLGGWLELAVNCARSADELVYCMYAEKLIDANVMDNKWCEMSFEDPADARLAKTILSSKEDRIAQSVWE